MQANITVANAAEYFSMADLYRLDELKRDVAKFIRNHKHAVLNSAGWNQYFNLVLAKDLILRL